MFEMLFELLIYVLVNYVFVYIGKAIVYALTLGHWRGERGADEARIHGAAGALSFVRDGQRVLTDRSAAFVGGAACIVLGLAWVALTW
ncbi:hypothetical protein HNP48_004889 [Acidovorax soli]|uniref:Uncharacterized protein n=1 Tax=Acidovorax soli TaxID=592050 RepID=A0A7X0PHR5_9BURK|nr:hypothetical protein [Acidovorax soli]MBB6562180.1 hypothetical protein [Acidovorax soli]